ncbi:MAG: TlyA family RNA methyltransferase [Clostridia bacterium]|nr:TlyA family RNA methyltransferase [Clostridia bacterium]
MRADKYFADTFGSRTKSAEAIEKGLVLVNGKIIRPKDEIHENDQITFITTQQQFVSNGGYKLQRAFDVFEIDCQNKVFVDIGASTGGFTDCLLQHGVAKVYAVDVGESLMHSDLLKSGKIVQMENTNARYLEKADFSDAIDGVVVDVSFISLRLIFPAIRRILKDNGDVFVLVKPQFECENKNISKNGIVRPSAHPQIVEKVLSYALENTLYPFGLTNAPIKKGKNIEYILHCKPTYENAKSSAQIMTQLQTFLRSNK